MAELGKFKICGRLYTILSVPRHTLPDQSDGFCDAPSERQKRIRIADDQGGQLELDTLIHEVIHAADWNQSEEWVTQVARDLARILYKMGWRKECLLASAVGSSNSEL